MDEATPSRTSSASSEKEATQVDLLSLYAPEPNALERRALSFLDGDLPDGDVPIGDDDRRTLQRIQRRTVWIGVASGMLSGLLLGGVEIWLTLGLLGSEERGILDDPLEWSLFYVVVGVVTLFEILFLYWITLRAVAEMKRIVGVPGGQDGTADLVRAALARAALESPNPEGDILGVDPHAYEPRWQLFLRNLVYKAKVGVTSFVLRIALRRLFVRAVLRSYVPLLAAPLYAAWNALILHRIMEEARVRAFGPFAVRDLLARVEQNGTDERFTTAVLAGTVALVRRGGDAHPNYILLLQGLRALGLENVGRLPPADDGEDAIGKTPPVDRTEVSDILLLVAILAGRPSRRQLAFLRRMHGWLDRPFPAERLVALRRALRNGERLSPDRRSKDDEAHGAMQLETGERLPTP